MAAGDELYELDPKEFTAARDHLAAELRTAGDKKAAAEVKALRRPTVTAWALNQLARRQGDQVRLLLEASAEVARAQAEASGGGDTSTFRQLTKERRGLVHRLAAAGAGILDEREPGSGAGRRDALVSALEAASMDEEGGEALVAGRLATEPQPAAGFGGFLAAAVTAAEGTARSGGGPSRREVGAARERAERARQAASEAADAADNADEKAAALERQLEDARSRAERARAKAEEAAAAADEAEGALADVEG